MQYFLNAFYTKMRLSQSLLSDMELFFLMYKMFPSTLDMKNAIKVVRNPF